MDENRNYEINGFDSAQKPADEEEHKLNLGSQNTAEKDDEIISAAFGTETPAEQPKAEDTSNTDTTEKETETATDDSRNLTSSPDGFILNRETSCSPRENYSSSFGSNSYSNPAYGSPVNHNPNPSPVKKPEKKKKRFSAATVVVSIICSAVIGFVSSFFGITYYLSANSGNSSNSGPSSTEIKNIVVEEEGLSVVEAVYEKCAQSIVGIRTTTSVMSFFGGGQEVSGEGSGIIYTSDGYILTNYHVISDSSGSSYYGSSSGVASRIDVYLPSDPETAIPASVIGYNVSSDLAVLKIEKSGLPAIEIGDSSGVKVGQFVIAIGNPGGLQFMGSVTYGVVGGVNRTLEIDSIGSMNLIQTDAAINPGNSGGALVDTQGKLIGINSSKLVDESYEGMGFAIPINEALEICDNIIANKDEPAPYIGVEISTRYTSDVLSYYNFPSGAVVGSVDNGSPADIAGIKRGDIITEFNGTKITEYTVLSDSLKQCRVGDEVRVVVYRSGKHLTFTVTIGSSN